MISVARTVLSLFVILFVCRLQDIGNGDRLCEAEAAAATISILSNCSYSYHPDPVRHTHQHLPQQPAAAAASAAAESVLGLRALPTPQVTLRLFNAGFGTTGTRTVFQDSLKQQQLSGCHWKDCYPDYFNALWPHFLRLYECIEGIQPPESRNCSSTVWMQELRQMLIEIASSGMHVLSDTPVQYLFTELRTLAPHAQVQHTLRNPHFWAVKRIAEHFRGDFICRPETKSHNPFHILRCIQVR